MSLNLGSLGMEDASFDFGGSYIMALDCGTTSVLATIVDEYGCIVAQARRSVKTSFPRPGWVEQDPMAVLASQIAVMMEVQFKSGIHSDRIAAIGISNQRETTVVWDRVSGQPIYNAIVWQCRRTAPLIDELVEQGAEGLVRSRTGLTLDRISRPPRCSGFSTTSTAHAKARRRATSCLAPSTPAHLQPHRRPGLCHRLHQCQPHGTL